MGTEAAKQQAETTAEAARTTAGANRSAVTSSKASSLLALQRQAGNRATTLVVQRKGAGGGGAGAPKESQAEKLLKSTLENYVGSLIEKGVPPAKVIILAAKLGNAFATGVGEALLEVRGRLASEYADDVTGSAEQPGGGLGDKQIAHLQNVRRWQAKSVAELGGILEKGLIALGKQAAEELASELVGNVFDKGMEKLTDAMSTKVSNFVLDRVTGEWVDASYLVREPVSKVRAVAESVGADVTKAFLQACGSAITAEGWDRMAAVAAATDAGVSKADAEKMVDEALKASVRSDDLAASVEEKFAEVSAKRMWLTDASFAQPDRRLFASSYPEVVRLAKEYDELWFWQRDARAAKRAELYAHYLKAELALKNLNGSDRTNSFEAELAVLRSRYGKLAQP
jgi:hypothetical protein